MPRLPLQNRAWRPRFGDGCVFEPEQSFDQAGIHGALALALHAQNRGSAASREMARARQLARDLKSALPRLDVAMAGAHIDAASDPSGAVRALESIRAEAVARGIPKYEFLARRALAEIERRRTPAAGAKLAEERRRDAKARGYGLYARALVSGPASRRRTRCAR